MASYHFTSTCKNTRSHVYLPPSPHQRPILPAKHAVPRKPRLERASSVTRGSPVRKRGRKLERDCNPASTQDEQPSNTVEKGISMANQEMVEKGKKTRERLQHQSRWFKGNRDPGGKGEENSREIATPSLQRRPPDIYH